MAGRAGPPRVAALTHPVTSRESSLDHDPADDERGEGLTCRHCGDVTASDPCAECMAAQASEANALLERLESLGDAAKAILAVRWSGQLPPAPLVREYRNAIGAVSRAIGEPS